MTYNVQQLIEYLKVLDCKVTDDLNTIKKRYRELSKKYHPDVCKKKFCEEKMRLINKAYEYLKQHFTDYFNSHSSNKTFVEDDNQWFNNYWNDYEKNKNWQEIKQGTDLEIETEIDLLDYIISLKTQNIFVHKFSYTKNIYGMSEKGIFQYSQNDYEFITEKDFDLKNIIQNFVLNYDEKLNIYFYTLTKAKKGNKGLENSGNLIIKIKLKEKILDLTNFDKTQTYYYIDKRNKMIVLISDNKKFFQKLKIDKKKKQSTYIIDDYILFIYK